MRSRAAGAAGPLLDTAIRGAYPDRVLALIIWGTRTSERVLAKGNFHCPACQTQREFEHKQLRRFFALYWIPIFPVATLAEWVECAACTRKFEPVVLQAPPQLQQGPAQAQWGQPQGPGPQGAQGQHGPGGGPPPGGGAGGGGGWGR